MNMVQVFSKAKRCLAIITILIMAFLSQVMCAQNDITVTENNWSLIYKAESHNIDLYYNGKAIFNKTFAIVKDKDNKSFFSYDATNVDFQTESVDDLFGKGKKITFLYKQAGKPDIERSFYFYDEIPNGFFTEAHVICDTVTQTNYIVPLASETTSAFLPNTNSKNRILCMPFSNDNWTRYKTAEMRGDATSYYATAIYDGISRNGLVVGAVEFDTWKFGIQTTSIAGWGLKAISCICGMTNSQTDDGRATPSINRHGSVYGKNIKSSKVFVGFFDDWRRGLEYYAETVAKINPPRPFPKKSLYGWNSWGAMAEKVNYEGVMDVVDYLDSNIRPVFHDQDSSLYVILDSYWDNMTQYQLRMFVATCKKKGMHAGIYWSPFCDWRGYSDGSIGNEQMEGSEYSYRDAIITFNGTPVKLHNAWALDPTHPGTRARMKYQIEQFKKLGFEYIKVDFLNNGMLEADSFYNPKVTTGTQAYNQGMAYLDELCGEDMFIDLSIAPTFPSQYGNARRISCDAWGNISSSEMVINCLSYSWWLDRVYAFNDPDHAVFNKFSVGENRVRMTSEVITGKCLLGDNFSLKGSYPGDESIRRQAETVVLNREIAQIGLEGRSFWPVYGFSSASGQGENLLMADNDSSTYLVAFNYSSTKRSFDVPVCDLGIDAKDIVSIKELWYGTQISIPDSQLSFDVEAKDVKVFLFKKKVSPTSAPVLLNQDVLNICQLNNGLELSSLYGLNNAQIFNSQGMIVWSETIKNITSTFIPLDHLSNGFFIAKISDRQGNQIQYKFFK